MEDLTTALHTLILGYPGKMAELSRRTGIDRSTLYKFAKGERLPSGEQLYQLAQALELAPNTAADLMLQGNALRGSDEPVLRAEVELLLNTLFRVQRELKAVPPLTIMPAAAEAAPVCGALKNAVEVEHTTLQLCLQCLQSSDVRPILVSPLCAAPLLHAMQQAFSAWNGRQHGVRQLLRLSRPGASVAGDAGNIRAITRSAPFLFFNSVNYEAHFVTSPTVENLPGILSDSYVLFPTAAVFVSGETGVLVTEPAVVENFRQNFEAQYRAADSFLTIGGSSHYFYESAGLYESLLDGGGRGCYLRWQPPLSLFLTEDIVQNVTLTPCVAPDAVFDLVNRYLKKWTAQPADAIFTRAGLLEFVRTGRISDLPAALYEPFSPAVRRSLLLNLRAACEDGTRQLLIADPEQLPLEPDLHIAVFEGQGVVFCQSLPAALNEPCCREYLLRDPLLTASMAAFIRRLKADSRLHDQNYTRSFIDSCLDML